MSIVGCAKALPIENGRSDGLDEHATIEYSSTQLLSPPDAAFPRLADSPVACESSE